MSMKNLFLIAIASIVVLASCNKDKKESKENDCPVVAVNLVPKIVKDSFALRYPTDSVRTWFNKDNMGYCAFFVSKGVTKLAEFSTTGNFVKEEIDSDENNEHEDNVANGKKSGCECEMD